MKNLKNEKNKSAVILNPERSEWVSRSHVTGVEIVVNDRAKTKRYSTKRDLYGPSLRSTLKMTALALILSLNLSTAWAEWSDYCPSNITVGTDCKTCGPTCAYTQTAEGVVTLYGTGEAVSGYESGSSPFWDNKSIKSVKADESSSFTSIGNYAFAHAKNLANVDIPNVTSIGDYVFYNTALTSIDMPKVSSIGDNVFESTGLTSFNMPNLSSIGSSAFEGLSNLTIADLTNITSIGDYAFWNSTSYPDFIISDQTDTSDWSRWGLAGIPGSNSKIYCLGDVDICKANLSEFGIQDKVQQANEIQCNNSVNYYYSNGCVKLPNSQETCTNANFYWISNKCTKTAPVVQEPESQEPETQQVTDASCSAKGQVFWDDSCYDTYPFTKKRWTPAEAAEWLHDGNDNFVIITFKK